MMNKPGELYIGLMSGTSLDAVDAVLVDFKQPQLKLLANYQLPLTATLKTEILALNQPGHDDLNRAMRMQRELGYVFADAVQALLAAAELESSAISAIGSHGQTVRHQPQGEFGFSLQLGDPATIAELTGIPCCADFRSRDIAAGGQGAPLVPAFHQRYLASDQQARAIVNIGGMANISLLQPGQALRGFDTGPGNVLMDAWIDLHLQQPFDRDGSWAATGTVNQQLLADLLQHPFFAQTGPKSTGRETFGVSMLTPLSGQDTAANIQATLLELTAQTIVAGLDANIEAIYLCGGGAKNTQLRQRIAALAERPVETTEQLGMSAEYLEAIAFAWLARCLIRGENSNAHTVTGAKGERILGAIYPA